MARESMKKRKAEKQRIIIEAAAQVFAEKGYHGALTDEIADRAGISKRTMYYYLGDKDELYEAVIKSLMDQVNRDVSLRMKPGASDEEHLKQLIGAMADTAKIQNLHSIVLRELFSGGANIPESHVRNVDAIFSLMKPILEGYSKQKGYDDTNPILVSWMIFSFFVMWELAMPFYYKKGVQKETLEKLGKDVNEKLVVAVEKMIFRMITAPKNSEQGKNTAPSKT